MSWLIRTSGQVHYPLLGDDSVMGELYQALCTGLRDYVAKSGFSTVVLGLSGGIDSALVAVIAADALGADRVLSVMLPSPYTSSDSTEDAAELARALGIRHETVPIDAGMDAVHVTLAPLFGDRPEDSTEENIQSRLRGLLLMAISNKMGHLLLTTGNKSEMAVGYATLYGDMCGGFNVLKDVYKTQVFALARWRNRYLPPGVAGAATRPVPQRIIDRPPSAELKPEQKDEDSLPPYPLLDRLLQQYIEKQASVEDVCARGFPLAEARRVWTLLHGAEYKRRQAAPGVKVSTAAFGRDWRYPLSGYRKPD